MRQPQTLTHIQPGDEVWVRATAHHNVNNYSLVVAIDGARIPVTSGQVVGHRPAQPATGEIGRHDLVRFTDAGADPQGHTWVVAGRDGDLAWIRRGGMHLTVPADWLTRVPTLEKDQADV